MTQEEKELLLKDLCARLPYGVKLRYVEDLVVKKESHTITLNNIYLEHIINGDTDIKPYLRSLSSMTEEERTEYFLLKHRDNDRDDNIILVDEASMLIDWLNKHYFDYRGLIERGLAIEAPEDMYNNVITK